MDPWADTQTAIALALHDVRVHSDGEKCECEGHMSGEYFEAAVVISTLEKLGYQPRG